MTETRELHPYEPVSVTRKPQLTLVAVKQRLDIQTQETTEVETVRVVQIEKAESPDVCDIPYFGKYYLFHRWFMTIEDVWSWKHSIPLRSSWRSLPGTRLRRYAWVEFCRSGSREKVRNGDSSC